MLNKSWHCWHVLKPATSSPLATSGSTFSPVSAPHTFRVFPYFYQQSHLYASGPHQEWQPWNMMPHCWSHNKMRGGKRKRKQLSQFDIKSRNGNISFYTWSAVNLPDILLIYRYFGFTDDNDENSEIFCFWSNCNETSQEWSLGCADMQKVFIKLWISNWQCVLTSWACLGDFIFSQTRDRH